MVSWHKEDTIIWHLISSKGSHLFEQQKAHPVMHDFIAVA